MTLKKTNASGSNKDDESAGQKLADIEELEKDFKKVVTELSGDQSFDRFREEYQKLHRALQRSHDNEKTLVAKCRQLNNELMTNAKHVGTALRLSSEDQNSIALLKKEIDKAWKMVDTSHEKEKRSKRTIQQLRNEVKNLSTLVESGVGLSSGQEMTVNQLLSSKNDLQKEVDASQAKIEKLNLQLDANHDKIEQMRNDHAAREKQLTEVEEKLSKANSTASRHVRRADKTEKALLNSTAAGETQAKDLQNQRIEISEMEAILNGKESELISEKMTVKSLENDLNVKLEEQSRLETLVERFKKDIELLTINQEELKSKMEIQTANSRKDQDEIRTSNKSRDKLHNEIAAILRKQEDVESQRDQLKSIVDLLQSEISAHKRNIKTDGSTVADISVQMKRLASNLHTSQKRNEANEVDLENLKAKCSELKSDITDRNKACDVLQKDNANLQKEIERLQVLGQRQDLKKKFIQEELVAANVEKDDINNQVKEESQKLKLQRTLYENVRSERNKFCQQNTESIDKLSEMRRKSKIMKHQIDQFKDEIQSKDKTLIKQHFQLRELTEHKQHLEKQRSKKDDMLRNADILISSQAVEVKTLRNTLVKAETASCRQKRIYESAVDERDTLGAHLIRRNDELSMLYNKIQILESTLEKGELRYNERMDDIKKLTLNVTDKQRQLDIQEKIGSNVSVLKNDVHHLQRELLQERTKVRALSEELENPINVHRWRKLEGSDPESFEMIQKIQTLQKRLIEKTEEVVEKDLLIQEKDKLYIELKHIIARQPGPEVVEQLSAYQQALRERTRQMKTTAAELNLANAKLTEFKYEVDRTTRELTNVKRKYFEQKRRESLVRESQRMGGSRETATADTINSPSGANTRYVGGGFAVS